MHSADIEDCIFISNRAYDGFAIYIEGDLKENNFFISIKNNTFLNNEQINGDEINKSFRSIIISEINLSNIREIDEQNTFSNADPKVVIIDHYGNPIQMLAQTHEPKITETPEPTVTETPSSTVIETSEPTVTETLEPTVTETLEPTVTETSEPTVTETPEPSVTRTILPTIAQSFTQSNNFTPSSSFTSSNTLNEFEIYYTTSSTIIDKKITISTTFSTSFSLTYVKQKSVSFSYSYTLSSTFELFYDESHSTYTMLATQHNYISNFPYIIYYLSPLYVERNVTISFFIRKTISPEQLIGVVCGSASVFFLILGIIIFAIQRHNDNKNQYNDFDDLSYSEYNDERNMETNLSISDYNQEMIEVTPKDYNEIFI